MKLASFESIVAALNREKVHFLVVGGVAVNAHGYLRYTKDVHLVVRLSDEDVLGAFRALETIDYHPAVPVTAQQFSDAAMRAQWRQEKGMRVLKFWSDAHRETPLDVFVYEPFDFDLEYQRALVGTDPDDPGARFAGIPALISMKAQAGRPLDLIDIEKLRQIAELRSRGN
ncbi:MAG: nucleotidyl transferase AbiEii/AbiGii toxin family protein [Chthoniobacterales bacterium]